MSQLKKTLLLSAICLFSFNANAGLYGLDKANPLTKEEINIKPIFLQKELINYPKEMRDNIIMLSNFAKKNNPDFQIIVHEGQDLLAVTDYEKGVVGYQRATSGKEDKNFLSKEKTSPIFTKKYLNTIDGVIKNDVFFKDGKTQYIKDSNLNIINSYKDAKNYWIAIDDEIFDNKQQKIDKIKNSNYDLVIINPIFKNVDKYTPEEIKSMKYKKNGAKRLLLANVNISELCPTDYRFKKEWTIGNPSIIKRKSLVDERAYIVEYWQNDWKKMLSPYFKSVVVYGYDGALLTGADNHKYFEFLTPVE